MTTPDICFPGRNASCLAREALAEAEADLAAGIVPVDAMINAWLERYWRDLRIGGTH